MRPTLCALTLLVAASAEATSLRATTVEERARLSDRVVLAEVLTTETRLPDDGDPRRMYTITTVRVLNHFKGAGASTVEIFQVGGRNGLWEARVPDDARFTPKERAVLFLRCRDAAKPDRCTLVGLKTGKLKEVDGDMLLEETPDGPTLKKPMSAVVAEVKKAATK